MQLTKDEIEALIEASYEPAEHGVKLNGEKLVRDAIAAHTAKVLGDVEPVGWMGVSGVGERIVSRAQIYPFMTIPLYPAHTVAALKSRADALAPKAGFVMVPSSALAWLFGEEGDFEPPADQMLFRGKVPPYWWRSEFRRRAGLAAAQPGAQESAK